ncbi:MAG: ACP S-malonyltransferase [Chlamydiales bacterium]
MKKTAFLFPGQGAQHVGMGKDFYDHYSLAKEVFQQGDDLLKCHLSRIIFEGPIATLTQTRYAQTAIYLTSVAILRVIEEKFPSLKPSVCAGLSLGELTALTASGRISFESCLSLVQLRAEAMNEACEATQGAMAAIFGLSVEEIRAIVSGIDDLWVANFNTPQQIVISGSPEAVERGISAAKAKGAKRAIPLKVHGAFHSGLMKIAREKLREPIGQMELMESPVDLVMNVAGKVVNDQNSIRGHLLEQVTSSVLWEPGIRAVMNKEVDQFIEIGPGKTLAGMNKQIGVPQPTLTVNTIEDLEKL